MESRWIGGFLEPSGSDVRHWLQWFWHLWKRRLAWSFGAAEPGCPEGGKWKVGWFLEPSESDVRHCSNFGTLKTLPGMVFRRCRARLPRKCAFFCSALPETVPGMVFRRCGVRLSGRWKVESDVRHWWQRFSHLWKRCLAWCFGAAEPGCPESALFFARRFRKRCLAWCFGAAGLGCPEVEGGKWKATLGTGGNVFSTSENGAWHGVSALRSQAARTGLLKI